MPVSAARLRRWFAAALIFVCAVVAGAYFYARHRVQNALKQVPGKIGIEIQQSAKGFTISKSDQGRTLFKLQASKAVQFKERGRVELHDVTITLYGRGSSRFDQVYGQQFEYDQQSGDVISHGEVSIDLQANPQGILNPDQATPKELKDPIHLKTTDLVFNQKTGDAFTHAPIEFRVSQASGSAVGAHYVAKDSVLTLESQVKIVVNGSVPSTILARQATLEKNPREIVLRYPHAESPEQQAQSDDLTLFLRDDNTLDHAIATGHVRIDSNRVAPDLQVRGGRAQAAIKTAGRPSIAEQSHISAQRFEVRIGQNNLAKAAIFSGDVQFNNEGPEPAQASAGRAILSFGARNVVSKVYADEQVKVVQHQRPEHKPAQDVELSAPAMDFLVSSGKRLTRAETIGSPEISVTATDDKAGSTHVTADKFIASFDSLGRLSQVHGEPNARVVTTPAFEASQANDGAGRATRQSPDSDRISTSNSIDAYFRPGTGIEVLLQRGNFHYSAGTQQAFADTARYTPANQIANLSGSPRIVDTGMETTARTVRLNRATGDGFADGDVKTTYSDLKRQPDGALLASSDPIHVTAQHMTAHKNPASAIYTGNARLWQSANVVEAPSIQFRKDQRLLVADSSSKQKVSTTLIGTNKSGKATPIAVTADHLTYRDSERIAHFEGGVRVNSADLTITSERMDVYLLRAAEARAPSPGQTSVAYRPATFQVDAEGAARAPQPHSQAQTLAKLDKIVASGSVVITEPNRRATGDQLTYTASDDTFVLSGGPPCIFDAEHGKITGVSLTFYRTDDRVVVEGDSSSPAITRTRVVR